MKVESGREPSTESSPRSVSFKELLKKPPRATQQSVPSRRRTVAPAGKTVLAGPKLLVAQPGPFPRAEHLTHARSGMNSEVARLGEVRSEGMETQELRHRNRLVELLVREFSQELQEPRLKSTHSLPRDPAAQPAPLPVDLRGEQAGTGGGDARAEKAELLETGRRAAQAAALIEKIDTFVRAQRPGLAFSVSGMLDVEVQVEKTGQREVALRLVGKRGLPRPEDVSRIRDELHSRGLRLSSLSVA